MQQNEDIDLKEIEEVIKKKCKEREDEVVK